MNIALSCNLDRFFDEALEAALRVRKVEATAGAKSYLVSLLSDFAHPDPLAEDTLARPFTFLLDEALHAVGIERFHRLRSLGDGVLYTTGFFRDHIETRGVSFGYVVGVGTIAYESAGRMFQRGEKEPAANVFGELASKLPRFVEVLAEISEMVQAQQARGERGLVKLYERWLRTGSARLAAELGARGITPIKGSGGVH